MEKRKPPRRRKAEPTGQLVPAPRQEPAPLPPAQSVAPALLQLLDAIRGVAATILDFADQTAEAITRRLQGRA
jgi:hypothetical protein